MTDTPGTVAAPPYASLLRRFQALLADTVILVSVYIVVIFAPSLLNLSPAATRALLMAFMALVLTYEPILVSRRGGTVGHYRHGIRVTTLAGAHLGFLQAFGRAVMKGLLGWFSFLFMLVTRRAQSLHDLAFRSLVVLADAPAASELDLAPPAPAEPAVGMPGRLRRSLVIAAFSIGTLVAALVITTFVASPDCLEMNRCSPGENLVFDVGGILWLVATGLFLLLGWRGRLWGCRRRASPNP